MNKTELVNAIAKNEGIEELVRHAIHVAKYKERPGRQDFCDADGNDNGALHRCIHSIEHLIEDPLADALLRGDFESASGVCADAVDGKIVLHAERKTKRRSRK